MKHTHDVISDFLDGEAFNPTALGEALADAEGRELLIDFVVMRYAAQEDVHVVPAVTRRASPRFFIAAAAAALLALAGGYQLGDRQSSGVPVPTSAGTAPPSSAPEPTRVLDASSWQAVTPGNN